jgi:hypothetical protein
MIIPSATLAKDYWTLYSMDDALERDYEREPPEDPELLAAWEEKQSAWIERWRKALEDSTLDQLPLVPGQKPIRWKLQHLRGKVGVHLRQHIDEYRLGEAIGVESLYRALELALVEVKDAMLASGKEFKIKHTINPETKFREVSADTMDQLLQIDKCALVYELGLRVITQLYMSKN